MTERYRLELLPVPANENRPLWSVLIPTHNCAAFLRETLESVLSQDPGADRMEIIVVDDHSTLDDPAAVVEAVGKSRVRFCRQIRNVGKVRNYETGLVASRGRLIHQLHGDDRVRQGFYAAMEDAFARHPDAGAFFCQSLYIDEHGHVKGQTGHERDETGLLQGWLDKIVVEQRIQTPSIVVRREVYETVGGFDRRLPVSEDWEMWIRVANRYPVGFVPAPLAEYRVWASSSTGITMRSGTIAAAMRDLRDIVDDYLPADVVERCATDRNRAMAQYLLQFIPSLFSSRHYRVLARLYVDALRFSRDPRTVYRLLNYSWNHRAMAAR